MSYVNGVSTWINSDFFMTGKILPGQAQCNDIDIKGKFVIIQTDHRDFKQNIIDTLFKSGKIRSISDYVVISDELILICEMKSDSNNESGMKTQLRNTGRLTRYLLETVREHHKIGAKIPPIKYVCFASKYNNVKQKTKSDKLDRINWFGSDLLQLPCNAVYHLHQFA